jgi:uroporphyrinogen-III synthase
VSATFVSAYKTEQIDLPSDVVNAVRRGEITAILVSSGTIARHLADQLSPIPRETAVVCIGPRTAFDAGNAGLTVSATAAERSNDALIDALLEHLDA